MIRCFILFAFIVINSAVFSQDDFIWVNTYGTRSMVTHICDAGDSELYMIMEDRQSRKVVSVRKATGDTIASMEISGDYNYTIEDLKADGSGNVYIAGHFTKNINIGSFTYEAEQGGARAFLARITPGEQLKSEDVLILTDLRGTHLGFTRDDHILLAGHFRHRAEMFGKELEGQLDDIFIMKMTPDYELLWIDHYEGEGDNHVTGFAVDEQENIFLSASFTRTIILQNDTLQLEREAKNAQAVWRMNQEKMILWHRIIRGYGYEEDFVKDMAITGDKIFLVANYNNKWKMNSREVQSMGRIDAVVLSLDKTGLNDTVLFHLKSPLDVKIGGLTAVGNNVFLLGTYFKRLHHNDQIYGGLGDTSSFSITADMFFINFKPDGKIRDFNLLGAEEADQALALVADKENVYLTGHCAGTVKFGSLEVKVPDYQYAGFITAIKNNGASSTANSTGRGCPSPATPQIVKSNAGYFGFEVQWKPVNGAKYYHLKIARDEEMKETVAEHNNIIASDQPAKKIEGLWTGEKYYFSLKAENECGEVSEAAIQQIETKCKTETYYFTSRSDNVCSMWFTMDCKGELLESGITGTGGTVVIRDSMLVIPEKIMAGGDDTPLAGKPESTGEDKVSSDDEDDTPGTARDIDAGTIAKSDGKCRPGEVGLQLDFLEGGKKESKTICVAVEKTEIEGSPGLPSNKSECNEPGDIEMIICLAREGMAEVHKNVKRMEALKKKMTDMVKGESSTESTAYKEAEKLWEEYERIEDSLEIIREYYEALIAQIAKKRTIKLKVQNSTYLNISEATVTDARWNRYDDAMKFPGAQLLIEFNISGFTRKKIESSFNRCLSEHVVFMDFVGVPNAGTFALSIPPCLQNRGTLITNIAVLEKLENLDYLHFKKTDTKGYNCDSWSKCNDNVETTADKKEMAFKEALKKAEGSGNEPGLLFYLAVIKSLEDASGELADQQELLDWAATALEGPYFDMFDDPNKAKSFMEQHHQAIQDESQHSRYNIYYIYTREYLEQENQECIKQAQKLIEMYSKRLKK